MAIAGIDLGTTNSLVAAHIDGESKLIPNAFGELLTPSVVSIMDNGDVVVGKLARERLVTAPDYIKRQFRETQVLRARAATWIGWLGARIEEGDVTPFMRKEPCAEFFALSGFDATLAEMLAPVVRGMDSEALLELEQAVNAPGDARETRALFDRVRAEIKHAHDQKLAPFKKAAIAIVALIYIVVRVWARSTY